MQILSLQRNRENSKFSSSEFLPRIFFPSVSSSTQKSKIKLIELPIKRQGVKHQNCKHLDTFPGVQILSCKRNILDDCTYRLSLQIVFFPTSLSEDALAPIRLYAHSYITLMQLQPLNAWPILTFRIGCRNQSTIHRSSVRGETSSECATPLTAASANSSTSSNTFNLRKYFPATCRKT